MNSGSIISHLLAVLVIAGLVAAPLVTPAAAKAMIAGEWPMSRYRAICRRCRPSCLCPDKSARSAATVSADGYLQSQAFSPRFRVGVATNVACDHRTLMRRVILSWIAWAIRRLQDHRAPDADRHSPVVAAAPPLAGVINHAAFFSDKQHRPQPISFADCKPDRLELRTHREQA